MKQNGHAFRFAAPWLKAVRGEDYQLELLDPNNVEGAFEACPGPLVAHRFTLDCVLPLAAAKEAVWDNEAHGAELLYSTSYHNMRATGKTNEAALILHHKIDHFCVQPAYKLYLDQTRAAAWTTNKHIERGRINEFVNKDGKVFMKGKALKASAIQDYYSTYDASLHIKRVLTAHVRLMNEEQEDKDYLQRYSADKVKLLAFFFEKFGHTWLEATRPSPVNRLTNRRSGNEPWKHVEAVSQGRRHIGAAINRMTWQEHVAKHSAKHARK